ncbi:MAG TPA: hypothetical protein VIV55_09805 [Flavobacterium sp.]
MRTIRTKVYFFNELSKEAQSVAIEKNRRYEDIFLDFFVEDANEKIEAEGFYGNISLQYSLSNSQGDGLSFKCDYFRVERLLGLFVEILGEGKEKRAKIIMENCLFESEGNNGRYCFASKSDIDYYLDNSNDLPNVENIVTQVREKLQFIYMKLCRVLEKQGYDEIEYQLSDEAISDTLIENQCEFTKDGNPFY